MTKHTYTVKFVATSVHEISFIADHEEHARQIMDDYFKYEFSSALEVQSVDDDQDYTSTYTLVHLHKEPDDYFPPTGWTDWKDLEDYIQWKENVPYYNKYKEPKDNDTKGES